MGGLFRYDGLLFRFINKMVDAVGLSLLWLITSLPLITMGAATTALYYTTHKVIHYDRGRVWPEYWKCFLSGFKQATPLGLFLQVLIYLLGANAYSSYLMVMSGNATLWIFLTVLIPLVLILMWAVYLFPLVARFHSTTKAVMKNCLLIALWNLPLTLLLVGLFVACIAVVVFVPLSFTYMPVTYMLLSSVILEKIFPKYMTPEDLAREQERNKNAMEDA
jgi:uncharacterized membrane protein YesL